MWAPRPQTIELRVGDRSVDLRDEGDGYYLSEPVVAPPGTRYHYRLNDEDKVYADPAGRFLPEGVHGPSEIVEEEGAETQGVMEGDRGVMKGQSWTGYALTEAVIYELHVGTFTAAGTFDGATERLDYLRDLGVNTVELLPLAQTPGDRNWGYDGVAPFAVSRAYGGPAGLRRFIRAAHARGIAVLIDVVYNHLGPEGNYLPAFMPVFTAAHSTPWGAAINFDRAGADGVRNYFLQNVRMWLGDYGADGLRLDAVHAIVDDSAGHFLAALSAEADRIAATQNREIILLAECDLNAPRFLTPRDKGGYGLTGQWADEFHHALHALLTGERVGYYEDFGEVDQLAHALRNGYVYTGQYSTHRGRNFGVKPGEHGLRPGQMTVFLQNHDQVGNRMTGDRLATQIDETKYLLGAATYLFSPFTPLLWMGEEWGERRPWPYFVHHGDEGLIAAVRKGRAAEFAAFQQPGHTVPDPQAKATMASAVLLEPQRNNVHNFYRTALRLRPRQSQGRRPSSFADIRVDRPVGDVLRWTWKGWDAVAYGNFGDADQRLPLSGEALLSTGAARLTDGALQLPAWTFALVKTT